MDHIDTRQIEEAARRLARARTLVVFTGAGVSKESGIPTFREPETGLWERYDATRLATLQAYLDDPAFVWAWYEHRFDVVAGAQPNAGHLAIARLDSLVERVTVVTQNVDELHRRAGSADVVELHGSMRRFKCLAGHGGFSRADFVGQEEKPPHCPRCGELLRPDVVLFGEALPERELRRALDLAGACDAVLVVGTTGVVYPAALVPVMAHEAGATVIDVNPVRDEVAAFADIFLQAPGGEALPRLVDALAALQTAG